MNRNKAPDTVKEILTGNFEPVIARLQNSLPVYLIQTGSQPVARIDMVFKAGSWYESKPLAASSANAMLTEGTRDRSGNSIAKTVDYYGAYLNTSCSKDNALITLHSLARHLESLLPLLAEIIRMPGFPDREFFIYKERQKQNWAVEKVRVANLAREKFTLALYGPGHPYGKTIALSDFENITREDIHDFHAVRYGADKCSIVVSGRFDEKKLLEKMDELFGQEDWLSPGEGKYPPAIYRPARKKQIFISRKNALQSAIRVGRELFDHTHPAHFGMMVLNTILGGHFGSRLMQNIREKKGYTYGIGSALVSLRNSGFLVIISETGTGYWKSSLKEIYIELSRLCDKPVSRKELELTRSHMLGEVLRGFDGPFARSESIRSLIENDLDTGYYRKLTETIRSIGPPELQDLAAKYLSPGAMYEVVAGKSI